jgi:hypothetical protein
MNYKLFPSLGGLLFLLRSGRLSQDDIDFGIFILASTRNHVWLQPELRALLPQIEAEGRIFYETRDVDEALATLSLGPVISRPWRTFAELRTIVEEAGQSLEVVPDG